MENTIKQILNKHSITFNNITKATSGFTNLVYFVDNNYVIKMSKDEDIKNKLNKETSIYKNIKLEFIPKFIASGEFNNYQYLIITKIDGKSLYSIWHTLQEQERQNCIKNIAKILKEFNQQNYDFLDEQYKYFDWSKYLSTELKNKSKLLEQAGFNVDKLNNFIFNDLPILFNKNNFGLVYNDAHFDNFIYHNKKLYLIDFDRVIVCPIDYEMLIFKTMCQNPTKFASEEDEEKILEKDYLNIYQQFKNEYKKMFANNYVEKRILIYQFNYLIGQAIKCNDNVWITELLNNFEKQIETN